MYKALLDCQNAQSGYMLLYSIMDEYSVENATKVMKYYAELNEVQHFLQFLEVISGNLKPLNLVERRI